MRHAAFLRSLLRSLLCFLGFPGFLASCRGRLSVRLSFVCLPLVLSACVSFPDVPAPSAAPRYEADGLTSFDGTRLAVETWMAEEPRAVLVALHGMNDYSETFALPAPWWAENAAIATYAIDQRGFGRSPEAGRWPGAETLAADLRAAVAAARAAHPGLPLFVLGHSMGAAVAMKAQGDAPLGADGLILVAPGVWGGAALPLPYRLSLNLAATIAPGKTLTGERAGRQPSDNMAVMRAMAVDPLVIKETRLDAILGVVRLMGEAYGEADAVGGDILFLIGEKDEVIPVKTMRKASGRLCGRVDVRLYPEGWHLLLRDLQGPVVWRDIADWIAARAGGDAPPILASASAAAREAAPGRDACAR